MHLILKFECFNLNSYQDIALDLIFRIFRFSNPGVPEMEVNNLTYVIFTSQVSDLFFLFPPCQI